MGLYLTTKLLAKFKGYIWSGKHDTMNFKGAYSYCKRLMPSVWPSGEGALACIISPE